MVEVNAIETILTDCEKKIIKQVEYYFGDVNLGRDKFLQEQIKSDDGWVPMETMLKFNRLKQITEDGEMIASALRKSTTGLMEVNDDGTKIRRSTEKPLPSFSKELVDAMKERSVYAKGFPKDLKLDQAMDFFEKYGHVDNIYMRRDSGREFKGSCFVTYKTKEAAEKFVAEDATKYSDDLEFIKFYKEDYFKNKSKQRKAKVEEQKIDKEKTEKESLKEKIVAGAILSITGLPEGIKRDEIKNALSKYGKVEWVDMLEDQKKVKARFSQTDEAKTVLEKLLSENEDGKAKLNDQEVECTVLEGEEELSHWAEVFKSKSARTSNKKGGKRNFGGSGKRRGGWSGGPRAKKSRGGDGNESD